MVVQDLHLQETVICPHCSSHRVRKIGEPKRKISYVKSIRSIPIIKEEDDWQQSYKCRHCFYLFEKDIK